MADDHGHLALDDVSAMLLDPTMTLPLLPCKDEKDDAQTLALALTPHMFDDDDSGLEYARLYADAAAPAIAHDAPPAEAALPTPPTPPVPVTPRTPTPPKSERPPRKHRVKTRAPLDDSDEDDDDDDDDDDDADDDDNGRHHQHHHQRRRRRRPQDAQREPRPDAKRSRCLERNRIAASKCREKKKQWVHELEATKDELEGHHATLQREYTNLLDEATQIKTSLMAHAVCNDRNIDTWIEAEALRFVHRSATRHRQALGSRHSSITSQTEPLAQSPTADARLSECGSLSLDYMHHEMFADDA